MITSPLVQALDQFKLRFKEYNLDQHTMIELCNIYRILYNHKYHTAAFPSVPIGILLETEISFYGVQLAETFIAELQSAGLIGSKSAAFEEKVILTREYRPSNPSALYQNDALIIYNCQIHEEGKSSLAKEYSAFYHNFMLALEDNHPTIAIAVVSPAVVRGQWQKDDQIYYRTFSHHIALPDMKPVQIYTMTLGLLASHGFEMSNDFKAKLQSYIDTVYPKADLKIGGFVKDLENRILTRYYSDNKLSLTPDNVPKLTGKHVPFYHMPKKYADVIAALDDLVAMDSIRAQFEQVYYMANSQAAGTKKRMHMKFIGSPGTGKTTVAKLMADMLYAMGYLKSPKLVEAKHSDMVSQYVGETPQKMNELIERSLDGVLFIDEAYALANTGISLNGQQSPEQQALDVLIQAMENYSDRLVVIFAGYTDAIKKLLDTNEGLSSRIGITIEFPDFTDIQLRDIFLHLCELNNLHLKDNKAQKALDDRIRLAKSEKNFGNARTIEQIFNEIYAALIRKVPFKNVITKEDIEAFTPKTDKSSLDDLIGFEEIKERVLIYEAHAAYLHELRKRVGYIPESPKHMLFVGNSGTGKTTVAKAIANDLYNAGVLANNRCTVIGAKDISAFAGSGKKLEEILIEARGGVLLIDEAYALQSVPGFEETLSTLLVEMENHPETIVIFAGYTYEMYRFINSNPGFASRIANTFYFPDFDLPELIDMYAHILESYQFTYDAATLFAAKDVIEYFLDVPNFGNGRFIRKMVEATIENKALEGFDQYRLHILASHVPSIEQMKQVMAYGYSLLDPDTISIDHKKRTAIHEMGHALMQRFCQPDIPVDKVTIKAGATYFGYMAPSGMPEVQTDEYFRNEICVCLGGRNAEKLIFGNHSTGCSQDYESAQQIANVMVSLAMVEDIGNTDIQPILQEADARTTALLTEHRERLLFLASMLLQMTTIEAEDFEALNQYYDQNIKR